MSSYYVDTAGDDENSGESELLPWLTVSHAQGALTGDQHDNSLLFKCGCLWYETFTLAMSGTAGHPFTVGSYETGAKPIIRGADIASSWTLEVQGDHNIYYATAAAEPVQTFADNTRLKRIALKANLVAGQSWYDSANQRIYVRCPGDDSPSNYIMCVGARDYCIDVNGKNYIDFSELYLDKANASCLVIHGHSNYINSDSIEIHRGFQFGWRCVQTSGGVYTLDYCTITNSTASGCGGPGIILGDGAAYGTIGSNIVYGNGQMESTDVGGIYGPHTIKAGIKLSTMETDVCWHHVIEKNKVYSNGTVNDTCAGIWLDGPVTFCAIRYNLVYLNKYCGIKVEDLSDDNDVYYNISYDNRNEYELGGGTSCYRTKFYNNVAYASGVQLCAGIKCRGQIFTDNLIKNNISIGHAYGELVWEIYSTDTGNVIDHNCFGTNHNQMFEYPNNVWHNTYASFEAQYGNSHSIQADPLFTNAGGHDFSLQSGSPCRDAGLDLGSGYEVALLPGSTWPAGILTASQADHGEGWEVGAFIYPDAGVWIVGALSVGGS